MKKFLQASACMAFIVLSSHLHAQDTLPVSFSFSKVNLNDTVVQLNIKGKIKAGIRLYALQNKPDDAVYSVIRFDSSVQKHLLGSLIEIGKTYSGNDKELGAKTTYYTDSILWQQTISATDSTVVRGHISYIYKKGEEFIPGEVPFKFFVQNKNALIGAQTKETGMTNHSLWWIFLAAFGGGLLALLTPCVYSMIPVTVSFFTKRSKTKKEGIWNALYYSSSIVVIFTGLGFLVTLLFGPAALNNLATNWIANLVFFALFLIFGFSFLGAFEISLPSSWTNKSDKKAGTGNILGIFFMALTLVLVSFSCTGPIIGNLLVLAAKGSYWGPLAGMFGFSTALALPFALFAFFPSKLNILGKAGGWLNAIKVTLGFLELALALKFLSNADLVKGWRLLDREIFLCLWIVIFLLLGIYLLGKLKFQHDDALPKNDFGLPYLTVIRLLFAIISLSFAVYMVPGLLGAPLKGVSAFVPPMGTQDFVANTPGHSSYSTATSHENTLPQPIKYYEKMKIYEPEVVVTNGMVTYFDYNEALEVARKLKRPLMLDFTGINCVNCRKMEGQVWSDPEVMKSLKDDFVIVSLYVDVQTIDLQENEIYYSKALGKKVETLGDKNADMQVTKFGANCQPYYFFFDANENKLIDQGYGYNPSITNFLSLLEEAKRKFKERGLVKVNH